MAGEKKGEKQKKASKTTGRTAGKTAKKPAAKTTKKAAAAPPSRTKAPVKTAKTAGKGKKPRRAAVPKDLQAFTEKMEHALLEQKSEIMENLVANNNDFREIVEGMEPKDLADVASDDIDRRMIETLGSQEISRLRLIDSALSRIRQGKYGICIKCERRIPQKRLEAIPYALMCIDCKSEDERRNR